MLITEDGQFHGLVSGGCLEGDLVLQAKKVFFDRRSRIVEYDMRAEEEGAWGLALGCNGLVRIHLQFLADGDTSDVLNVCELADKDHEEVLLLTDISEKAAGVAATGIYINGKFISDSINEPDLGPAWSEFKQNESKKMLRFRSEKGGEHFAERVQPQFNLLVLGAGPDAEPVCTMAKLAGWHVTLVDHRVAYVSKASVLDADTLIDSRPLELADNVNLQSMDAALLMSHNLNADTDYFSSLIRSSIPYIGMLGPRDRSEIIIGRQEEMADEFATRVHAPVGLDIGGEGPEAIALSIISEIQAHASRRSGSPLRHKVGGIHD